MKVSLAMTIYHFFHNTSVLWSLYRTALSWEAILLCFETLFFFPSVLHMLNFNFHLGICKFSDIRDLPSKFIVSQMYLQQAPPGSSFELYLISIFYFLTTVLLTTIAVHMQDKVHHNQSRFSTGMILDCTLHFFVLENYEVNEISLSTIKNYS